MTTTTIPAHVTTALDAFEKAQAAWEAADVGEPKRDLAPNRDHMLRHLILATVGWDAADTIRLTDFHSLGQAAWTGGTLDDLADDHADHEPDNDDPDAWGCGTWQVSDTAAHLLAWVVVDKLRQLRLDATVTALRP